MKNRWAFAGRRGSGRPAGRAAASLGAVGCANDPPIEGESSAQTDVTDPSGIDSTTDPNGTTGTDVTTGDGTDVTTGDKGTTPTNHLQNYRKKYGAPPKQNKYDGPHDDAASVRRDFSIVKGWGRDQHDRHQYERQR